MLNSERNKNISIDSLVYVSIVKKTTSCLSLSIFKTGSSLENNNIYYIRIYNQRGRRRLAFRFYELQQQVNVNVSN